MQPRKARPMKPLLDLFKNSAAQKTVNGPSKSWNCPTCTFLNQPGCVKCDMCFTQWVPAQNQQEIFITSPEEPRCNQRAATDHVDIEEDSQSRNQTPSTVSPSCASAAPRLAGSSRNSGHCDSSSGTNGTGRSTSSVAECDDKSDKDLALDESKQEPQVFESPAMGDTPHTKNSITPTQPFVHDDPPIGQCRSSSSTYKINKVSLPPEHPGSRVEMNSNASIRQRENEGSEHATTHSSYTARKHARDLSDLVEAQRSLGFDLLGDMSEDDETDDEEERDQPSNSSHREFPEEKTPSYPQDTNAIRDSINSMTRNAETSLPATRAKSSNWQVSAEEQENIANYMANKNEFEYSNSANVSFATGETCNTALCSTENPMSPDDWNAYRDFVDQMAHNLLPHFYSISYLEELQRCGFASMMVDYGAQFNAQKESKHFTPQELREAMRRMINKEDLSSFSKNLQNLAKQQLTAMEIQRAQCRDRSISRNEAKRSKRGGAKSKRGGGRGAKNRRRGQGAKRGAKAGPNSIRPTAVPAPDSSRRSTQPVRNHSSYSSEVQMTDVCGTDDTSGIQLTDYDDPLLANIPSSIWEMSGRTTYGYD